MLKKRRGGDQKMAFISGHVIKKVGAIKKKNVFQTLTASFRKPEKKIKNKKTTHTKKKKKKKGEKILITELLQIYIFTIT